MVGSEKDITSRFQRSQDHHEAYLRLIRWELDDELAMTEERLRNWSDKKLEANGIALFGLRRFDEAKRHCSATMEERVVFERLLSWCAH